MSPARRRPRQSVVIVLFTPKLTPPNLSFFQCKKADSMLRNLGKRLHMFASNRRRTTGIWRNAALAT